MLIMALERFYEYKNYNSPLTGIDLRLLGAYTNKLFHVWNKISSVIKMIPLFKTEQKGAYFNV